MLKSMATVSISGMLKDKLTAIARAGFQGVEIFESDLLASPQPASEIGAMLRDLGLACTALQPLQCFEGMPAHLRPRAFERAERRFDVMRDLGTELLIVTSNVDPEALGHGDRIADDLRELGQHAAARGLRVGYEALAWGKYINDHRDAWAIVQQVAHPAVGLVLDSFGTLKGGGPLESLRSMDVAKLFHVQIADAPDLPTSPEWLSQHFRCMPGQGDLAVVEFAAVVQDLGYDGALSLEIFNDHFRSAPTDGIALDGMRALTWLFEELERARRRRSLPIPDPRVVCQNVEFFEFCASDEEAPRLEQMLRKMGFVPTERHRRKAVTRWRQGEINLIVNCEPEGFAPAFRSAHGASVCAIGLRVDDPHAALERARGLRIGTYTQDVGPGEFRIPAVVGVGNSLIYFFSTAFAAPIWDTEFLPVKDEPDHGGVGLCWVDHFTQVMSNKEMPSWLLFYLSLFEATKVAATEVAEPAGLTLSQALQSKSGRLRIVLNEPESDQTLASRFLNSYGGAGLQQIAFATDDIFLTAKKMRALGMEFLGIPENYYTHVGAEFGLDAAALRRLKEFNILYDRDATGEYFHIYTRAFAKRFFFEIVERRGYQGYGFANSAIKYGAQSQFRNQPPQ
jgi:4-hydroxyphenylpyruvate dioxygenase